METESGVCAGCLCEGRQLRGVSGSPHEEYFTQVLSGYTCSPLDVLALFVCWECAAMLRRVARFRHQVELSCRTLSALFNRCKQPTECEYSQISKPSKYTIVSLENTSYPETPTTELGIKHENDSDCSDNEVKNDQSDDDVKNADDANIDRTFEELSAKLILEVDVKDEPIADILKKKKEVKKRKKLKKKSASQSMNSDKVKKLRNKIFKQLEEKEVDINSKGKTKSGKERLRRSMALDPEKIRTIVLTQEELLLERASDAQSEAYLKLPYKCENCIQGFDHEQTLKDHTDRKHNVALGKFQCETCMSVLGSQASYSTHRRRHLLRFECAACGKRTLDKGAMVKHYGAEHEAQVTRYTCTVCDFVSQSYRTHRYHKEKHKEKPQCEDCGKTFINKNSLRCHILNMHRGGRTFACDTCHKTYRGKSGLLMHMWTHDARARAQAYCAPCRVHFNTLYNYQHHLRTSRNHRSEEDFMFACGDCEKRFLTQRQMREHVAWVHLNSTEHQCEQCNKAFKHRVGLERHRKYVHEKLRPPRDKMCHHCGRGFTTASILRTHIRTHTGERPLSCAACPATFSHSAALYTHNKLVHRDARARK